LKGFSGPRCDLPEVLRATGCPEEHVYLRGSSHVKLGQDNEFSDYGDDEDSAAVQVRPQSAQVTLRAGMILTYVFKLNIKNQF
jgi:hypothetical protein